MTIAELRQLPQEELTWQLLGSYEAVGGEYERWAAMLDLDPDAEATEQLYGTVHNSYPALWMAMGDEFHERLRPIAAEWRKARRAA
jgi:hypothetical protein